MLIDHFLHDESKGWRFRVPVRVPGAIFPWTAIGMEFGYMPSLLGDLSKSGIQQDPRREMISPEGSKETWNLGPLFLRHGKPANFLKCFNAW